MGNERMTEIVRHYGPERIIVDSACDWGVSDPLAVPKTAALMARTGHRRAGDPAGDLRQRARRLRPVGRDEARRTGSIRRRSTSARLFEGNSVLRGGQAPRIEAPRRAGDLRIS